VHRARRAAWLVVPGVLCVAAAASCDGAARVTKGDPSDGGPPADATRQDGVRPESLQQDPSPRAAPPDAGYSDGDRLSSVEGGAYSEPDASFDGAAFGIFADALSCARLARCCESVARERRDPCEGALEFGIPLFCEAELTNYQSDGDCSVGSDAGDAGTDAAPLVSDRTLSPGAPALSTTL
jgi:hypothetical protein